MNKISYFLIIALMLISPVFALSSNELIEKATLYDGEIIEYQGEVIGDIMMRQENSWLNVNDGNRAIGIWVKNSQIPDVRSGGDYNKIGDKIIIRGVLHRACPDHGGDLDIHATEVSLMQQGYKVEHPVSQTKIIIAGILLLALLAIELLFIALKRFKS